MIIITVYLTSIVIMHMRQLSDTNKQHKYTKTENKTNVNNEQNDKMKVNVKIKNYI